MTIKKQGIPNLIKYLDLFPLKTKKKESFSDWVKIYNLLQSHVPLNKETLNEIKSLTKSLNINNSLTHKIGYKD